MKDKTENKKSDDVHFITLNVRGICDALKRKKIFLWLNRQRCDIAFLQETFLSKNIENCISKEWKGLCVFDHGTSHSKGVAIFVKENLNFIVTDRYYKRDGRSVAIRFVYQDRMYLCINVYAPAKNNQKEEFYLSLSTWVKKIRKENDIIIAGGDWNCVQNKIMDTSGVSYAYSPKKNFVTFRKNNNLVDVWRKMYPDRKLFTWRQLSLHIYSRLDYWLVSKEHLSYISSIDIKPVLKCDHNGVSMKMKVFAHKRGKGCWKLNNSLLSDEVYKQNIKRIIKIVCMEFSKFDHQFKWEMCKIRIKEFSIKYAVDLKKRKKNYIFELESEFNDLCRKLDKKPCEDDVEKMNCIRQKIDKWYEYQCKGAFVRSRSRWLELGEKSTKYFLQLERSKGKKKEIDCLEINGKIIKDEQKILSGINHFYSNLYNEHGMSDLDTSKYKEYLSDIKLNILTEDDANICEGLITESECFYALKTMKLNKSPGSDGLTVEFYKCFWNDIKQMVIDSLNEGYDKKQLSCSQSQAILTLLYKKGDKNILDNWRPISLLNIDYKLAARIISMRLKKVIDKIVSDDQAGFLKNRSTSECIRLVQDMIDYCVFETKPAVVMFLDFRKAFDTINHNFLFYLLREFKFKDSFLRWLQTLYNNAHGRVLNFGWVSDKFAIKRGVRQGCPLSGLLFIIVAEVLALKIKQNKEIKGVQIQGRNENKDIRVVQYADDTTIMVNSIKSARKVMQVVETFGKHAGPVINWAKSNFMKLNIKHFEIGDLILTENPVKYLGVYVGKNNVAIQELNWNNTVEKIKNTLDLWKMRNLTLYGKVVVIKLLIVSKLVHVATAALVPSKIIKDINKLIFAFLWNSRKEKVKRSVCHKPVSQGGLGMIDLRAKCRSLRLSWIRKYFIYKQSSWKLLFEYWTRKIGKFPLCLNFNCNRSDMHKICEKRKLPEFYVDMFCSWADIKYISFLKVTNIENEIIWYNSNIRYRDEVLHFPNWTENDIYKVKQVLINGVWKDVDLICDEFRKKKLLSLFKLSLLKSAFPNVWLEKLRNRDRNANQSTVEEVHTIELVTGDFIDISSTKAKHYYNLMVELSQVELRCVYFWNAYFDLPNDFDWKSLLNYKFQFINDNRIKQFNFKFIHRILPCKDNLYKWKIKDDNLCEVCNVRETCNHFLFSCTRVSLFWKILSRLIDGLFNVNVVMNDSILLTGYEICKEETHLINLLINFAQFVIYRNYIRISFGKKVHNMHPFYLLKELKSEIRLYLSFKVNTTKFKKDEIKKLMCIL